MNPHDASFDRNPEHGSLLHKAAIVGVAVILALEVASSLGIRDPRFRAAFAVVWVSMAVRRLWFRENGRLIQGRIQEDLRTPAFILSASIPWLLLPALAGPGSEWFAPTVAGMPMWLRWAGAAVGTVSICAPFLSIRDGRALGWSGDSSAILSLFLLSANWLVGLLGVAGLSLVLRQTLNPPKLCRHTAVQVVG